jgi:UDP-3-O-[3-hydroxymyristoyl] N-acetylglucosamine deacetylase/3-hydroxyacyl-[acyl-carrier-protein] dehydratase
LKPQQTISQPAEITGRGLFTGEESFVRFKPAPVNAGITFVRSDQPAPVRIAAVVENVTKRARRTTLRNGTVAIETVEHCLSACSGLGVDNLEIEISADELPSGDGSSQIFVDALRNAGFETQSTEKRGYRIEQPVRVTEGDAELVAWPGEDDSLTVRYELDYGGGPIGRQAYSIRLTPEDYLAEIAPSRTFVLQAEAEQLQAAGLGCHLTYRDILVFNGDGPIENELRYPEECVRHKILDLIGDLMLFGRPIWGNVFARRSGHALNHSLVRHLRKAAEVREANQLAATRPTYDVRQIQRIIPHRYPLLMIDRVVSLEGTERAVAIKNVTINEAYFQGHYPGQPIMPGVLVIEAMAQLGGILLSQELEHKGKIAVLLSLDKVKFRRPVVPGDQLILEALAVRVKARTGHVRCNARVGDTLVAEADVKFMMVDADPI